MIRSNLLELTDPDRALTLLKEGNKRYVECRFRERSETSEERRLLSEKGQFPFAVILGCSDSRLPPEIIFDVGLGQIFVVRTAGNVADAMAIGSVEYAVEHLKTRLVVVLGHQKCGAVAAAVSGGDFGPNIGAIVSEIEPAIAKVRSDGADEKSSDFVGKCESESIMNTAAKLAESKILKELVSEGTLKIRCAKYSFDTGEVDFFSQ
ncbi:MAG: carbonic anhydrase [Oscillospiraceae bacterium]|nr:carbonic anhydrase [Oscillospiraceae bacterium]